MNNPRVFDEKFIPLLERTFPLFCQYGIRSLSMDDISRHMAISKKTLYQFVSSKDELVEAVMTYMEQKHNKRYEEITRQDTNAIDKLLEASKYVNHEMKVYNPVMVFDLQKYYPEIIIKHFEAERQYFSEKMRDNLIQGIQEGLYRNDLSIELVAILYVSNLVEMHRLDEVTAQKITFDDIFQVMFENYIRGIGTPEGIAYFEKAKSSLNFHETQHLK